MEAVTTHLPKVTTVMHGLDQLKVGLPLAALEVLHQLGNLEVMEFQAVHSSGANVQVKMYCNESNIVFEINADGQSLLTDEGEGWQCMIGNVTGDVYHHLAPQPSSSGDGLTDFPSAILGDSNLDQTCAENSEKPDLYQKDTQESVVLQHVETSDGSVTVDPNVKPEPEPGDNYAAVATVAQQDHPEFRAECGARVVVSEVKVEDEETTAIQVMQPSDVVEYISTTDSGDQVEPNTAVNYYITEIEEQHQQQEDSEQQPLETTGEHVEAGAVTEYMQGTPEIVTVFVEDGQTVVASADSGESESSGFKKIPRIVQDVSAYSCYMCKRKYVLMDKLRVHVGRIHKASFNINKVEKTEIQNAHICFICNQVCPHYDGMRKHLQRVHKTGDTFRNNRKVGDPGVSGLNCVICQKCFVTPVSLSHHLKKEHRDDELYTQAMHGVQDVRVQQRKRQSKLMLGCPICAEVFHGRLLFRHINRDHSDIENKAEILKACHTAYNKESKNVWHVKPTTRKTTNCSNCGIEILKRNMSRHEKLCTGKPRRPACPTVECPECHKHIGESTLQKHMRHRCPGDGEHVYMCRCDQYFKSFAGLQYHLLKVHGETTEENMSPADIEATMTLTEQHTYCEYCTEPLQLNWLQMRHHKTEVHGIAYDDTAETITMSCGICSLRSCNQVIVEGGCMGLLAHQRDTHKCRTVMFCDICNTRLLDGWKALNIHKKKDHGLTYIPEEVPTCSECGLQFLTSSQLGRHVWLHHRGSDQVVYGCGQCETTVVFSTVKELDAHSRAIHLGDPEPETAQTHSQTPDSQEVTFTLVEDDGAGTFTNVGDGLQLGVEVAVGNAGQEAGPPGPFESSTSDTVVSNLGGASPGPTKRKAKRASYADKIQMLKEKMAESDEMLAESTATNTATATATNTNTATNTVVVREHLVSADEHVGLGTEPVQSVSNAGVPVNQEPRNLDIDLVDGEAIAAKTKSSPGKGRWVHIKGDILSWVEELPPGESNSSDQVKLLTEPGLDNVPSREGVNHCLSTNESGDSNAQEFVKVAYKGKSWRKYLLVLPKTDGEGKTTVELPDATALPNILTDTGRDTALLPDKESNPQLGSGLDDTHTSIHPASQSERGSKAGSSQGENVESHRLESGISSSVGQDSTLPMAPVSISVKTMQTRTPGPQIHVHRKATPGSSVRVIEPGQKRKAQRTGINQDTPQRRSSRRRVSKL